MNRPPAPSWSTTPAWPLASASRSISDDIGNCRPLSACEAGAPERHHCGEDLAAPAGTVVLSTAAGTVVAIDPAWYRGTSMLLLQTADGPAVVYGEIAPDSWREFGVAEGVAVGRGVPLARVGRFNHLHFETYAAGTRRTYQWPWGTEPPAPLRDAVAYLRAASGEPARPVPDSNAKDGGGGLLVLVFAALMGGWL